MINLEWRSRDNKRNWASGAQEGQAEGMCKWQELSGLLESYSYSATMGQLTVIT